MTMAPRRKEGRGARRSSKRPVRSLVLIVCEGRETEVNYFYGLRQELRDGEYIITIRTASGGSALKVVEHATAARDKAPREAKYDLLFCVADVDNKEQEYARARALARKKGITLIGSNPCFEVWLLLHLEQLTQAFERPEDAHKRLSKLFVERLGVKYDKADAELFARLRPLLPDAFANFNRTSYAQCAENGDLCQFNPATQVPTLLQRLGLSV